MNWFKASPILAALLLAGCLQPLRTPPLALDGSEKPSSEFSLPLPHSQVLSPFGRRHREFHTGIDLRARKGGGDEILAARAGRVTQVRTWRGYGRMVTIRHADGFTSRYAHLRRFLVKEGASVKTGTPIGVVGRTGRATTAHLHFEILTPTGRFMDPGPLIGKKR